MREPATRRRPATQTRSFAREVLPALAWTVFVFVAGSLPMPPPTEDVGLPLDKVGHAVVFGVLAWLGERALAYLVPVQTRNARLWSAAAVSTALGGVLELYQLALPHRSAELADLAADALGAAAVALALNLAGRRAAVVQRP